MKHAPDSPRISFSYHDKHPLFTTAARYANRIDREKYFARQRGRLMYSLSRPAKWLPRSAAVYHDTGRAFPWGLLRNARIPWKRPLWPTISRPHRVGTDVARGLIQLSSCHHLTVPEKDLLANCFTSILSERMETEKGHTEGRKGNGKDTGNDADLWYTTGLSHYSHPSYGYVIIIIIIMYV